MDYGYAHKINRKKINELVKSVFPLHPSHSKILKIISTSTVPSNLKEITEYFDNSDIKDSGKTRWSVARRLNGSKKIDGLIPFDLVYPHHEENTYHDMYRYYLTIKGIFASLYEVDFNSINSFNWYFDYANNIFNDKKLLKFTKNFIYSQIIFFLYVHKIKGIQLTKLVNTSSYCELFFNSGTNRLFENLPLENITSFERNEFKKISIEFFTFRNKFKILKKSNSFPKMKISDQHIPFETHAIISQPKMINYSSHILLQYWYYFIPMLQITYYKTKKWNQSKTNTSIFKEDILKNFIEEVENKVKYHKI